MSIVLLDRELRTSTWKLGGKLAQYTYLYVAPTRSCGLGLFAAKAWTAGSTVLRVDDPQYLAEAKPFAQLRARGYTYAELFQVGRDLFIPHTAGWTTSRTTAVSRTADCGWIRAASR